MTRNLMLVLGLIAVLAFGAQPALAHHGGAAFDQTKTQTLTGTLTRMDFVNPHVVVYINVQNPDGTTTEWSGWLTAPNKLQRAGWSKNTLKPGDKVTLVGNQQKNGSPVLQIRKVTGPEGDLPTFEQ
jgi:Cu/Ag efflux protein CusF